MTTLRNLIFDLDGTLIDSSRGVIESVNFALAETGQPPLPPDFIKRYIGFPLTEMFANRTAVPYERLLKLFRVKAGDVMAPYTEPLQGADDVLNDLKNKGYRMAVATTKIKPQINRIMAKLGWEGFFEVLVGGDEVSRVKPDPEIFQQVLDQLGVGTDEAVVIGDTVNDILGARAAGLKIICIRSPFGSEDEMLAAGPDYLIESLAQLPDILSHPNLNGADR